MQVLAKKYNFFIKTCMALLIYIFKKEYFLLILH